ncbi:MAG: DNA primase [Betaproteobacteria bacterium RIFCSPLOWO2_12_FULL_62_13]|nr:MAG: DNA primase [Betaproteobacteria bacterium RIFCSPLOWO2_12_FULL_62_13]
MIPQSFIQDLLNRVDIIDVVDRHVKLKRAGANYVACCPFHNEKTPSFTVSQAKQFYHCFGCGAHGTAVGFLMEHSGLGFVEAVKELAQSVGMKVPDPRSEPAQRKAEAGDDLYAVLLKAAQFYRAQLKAAPQAIDYLKKRGLSGEIAKRFGIGHAPDGWQNLAGAFPDYNATALVTAGLVKANEENRRYDVFRDRIMFPIVDVRGNVIGFGGRVLGDGEPKYLNSPETPIFEKGRELYGLYQARRAIRDAGRVVVVEGYMDVVALAQHGIEYAVATLGTATTALHVQKLLRQADEVVFCFDGDDAGRRAAWRALENSLAQLVDGKQVRFLFLPQGEDPDTYVRKAGKAGFEALLKDALPLSAFLLRELVSRVDLESHEGRAKLLQDAKPLVKQVAAPVLSVLLRGELARLGGLDRDEIDRQYGVERRGERRGRSHFESRREMLVSNERRILQCLVFKPELHRKLDVRFGGHPSTPVELFLNDLIAFTRQSPELTSSAAVIQEFAGGRHDALLREVEGTISEWREDYDVDQELADAIHKVAISSQQNRVKELLSKRVEDWTAEERSEYLLLLQQQPLTAQLSK